MKWWISVLPNLLLIILFSYLFFDIYSERQLDWKGWLILIALILWTIDTVVKFWERIKSQKTKND
jgi:hypothetical protein